VPVSSQAAAAAAALSALLQWLSLLQRWRLPVLPLQPAPLLSSLLPLELGPVPPERLPQLERLLAVVLPLQ